MFFFPFPLTHTEVFMHIAPLDTLLLALKKTADPRKPHGVRHD